MVEGTLLEKLRKIEALHAGTAVEGEREASRRAAERIRARLAEFRAREEEVEYRYSLPDPWKRKLFVAHSVVGRALRATAVGLDHLAVVGARPELITEP